ncbi:D-2-hydroxyacid dehydrogenase [Amphibacillus sp. Q70]|uniref:D-2-hydroxyacid dehydrogenase n=1 Tax=Amphibacillus sp. Q70 TaxID=3453416 RepID=UPI003F837724
MLILSSTRFTEDIEQQLKKDFEKVTFKFMDNIDQASEYLSEADVLLTYGSDIEVKHIDQAKQLKWIMVMSAGIDKMPNERIQQRNILMTNVRGIHKIPMAEYALTMLLSHYKNHLALAERQQNKVWDKTIEMREIAGCTLTIVGAGAIGEEVARLGQAFQMETIAVTKAGGTRPYFDHVYQNSSIKSALETADFVVSILPSTKETEGYYQDDHFKWMKSRAIFLNMGRGNVVAEETLLKALNDNQIEHAILDVTQTEPLPQESPLWTHEKVTLTPHISGKSEQYVPRAIEIFRENLVSFIKEGSVSVNQINLDRGY